jgi:hypothetical protein
MSIKRLEKPTVCVESYLYPDSQEHCIALYSVRFAPGNRGVLELCPMHLRDYLRSELEDAKGAVLRAERAVSGSKVAVQRAEPALLVFSELELERWNNNDNERNTP